jgi:hypothetical protein
MLIEPDCTAKKKGGGLSFQLVVQVSEFSSW